MRLFLFLLAMSTSLLLVEAQRRNNRRQNGGRQRGCGAVTKGGCRLPTRENHSWTDPRDGKRRGYVLSWKLGCNKMTQKEAVQYCRCAGMETISLDTRDKQEEFNNVLARDNSGRSTWTNGYKYFWTGGIVNHRRQTVAWNNRNAPAIKFSESSQWSPTGRNGQPQPDNRDRAGEKCLGVLMNVYQDGIKWHDVACHHTKPTICEPKDYP